MEKGWTIAEAITRLAPADLLMKEHAAREAQLQTIRQPPNPALVLYYQGTAEQAIKARKAREARAVEEAANNEYEALRHILMAGRLAAWGLENSATGPKKNIDPYQWASLPAWNELYSAALFRSRPPEGYFGVHIYPILEAEDAAERIQGKPLRRIIEEFVFGDPEVSKRALEADPQMTAAALLGLSDTRGLVPVLELPEQLASHLRQQREGDAQAFDPEAINELANVTTARLAALFSLLQTGAVSAVGLDAKQDTGKLITITGDVFRRESTRICLLTGDIWTETEGQQAERSFGSVKIRPAESENQSDEGEAGKKKGKAGPGRPRSDFWANVFDHVLHKELLELADLGKLNIADLARGKPTIIDKMAEHAQRLISGKDGDWKSLGCDADPENGGLERAANSYLTSYHPELKGMLSRKTPPRR
jgi:hypothetical protein